MHKCDNNQSSIPILLTSSNIGNFYSSLKTHSEIYRSLDVISSEVQFLIKVIVSLNALFNEVVFSCVANVFPLKLLFPVKWPNRRS